MSFGPLVEAGWLLSRLGEPGLAVVDCRWRLGEPDAGARLYADGHLPGAAFLDVERDLSGPPGPAGRHPLPDAAGFERAARRTGIGAGSRVVAYDDGALGGAARLWWLLRHFGHEEAAVLDGGIAAWTGAGGELERGEAEGADAAGPGTDAASRRGEPAAAGGDGGARGGAPFVARPRRDDVATADELLSRHGEPAVALIDARAPERYRGEVEPVDPAPGHVPGARNVPFAELAPEGRFRPPEELRERLAAAGAREGGELVAYCGSGVTACTVLVATEAAGLRGARLYPGSWSEWSRRGLPVATGAEP